MSMNRTACIGALAAFVIGTTCSTFGVTAEAKASPAENAIRAAARQRRYVFVTFYKKNDDAGARMLAEARKLQSKYSDRANFVVVDVNNASDQAAVSRYGADRSPIPLTLVIAPNGAVTAGFPNAIKKTDLSGVFVSKGKADVLRALQNQKLAVLCLQNARTKHNKQSLAAAKGLASEPQFRGLVQIVQIDPRASAESTFLRGLKVNTISKEAQIVVLASAGSVIGRFSGASTTYGIVTGINKSLGCGSGGRGCAPGG